MATIYTTSTSQNAVNFYPNCDTIEIKVYKRRFWILFMYCFLTLLCGLLYPQYVAMAGLNTCYYGVSNNALNFTSTMFMIGFFVLFFPASAMIERIDLRNSVILGSLFNTIACALQFTGVKPSGFPFVLLSTFVGTLAYLVVAGTPPYVAAKWFPSNELARACAFGVSANQVGVGVSFIFSPLLVTSDCTKKEEIEEGKRYVAIILTASSVALLILILLTFQNAPKLPPSANECGKVPTTLLSSIRTIIKMLKNTYFILLSLVYGMMLGTYMAFLTSLNDLLLRYFPNKQVEIGWMGLIFNATGIVGSIIAGWVLDYTRRYKETYLGICITCLVLYIIFSVLLFVNFFWMQFLLIGLLGFFLISVFTVGFEYGIEVTYPDSEALSGNVLMAFANLFGLLLTPIISTVLDTKGPIWSNTLICIIFLICCIMASFIPRDYKRTKNNSEKTKTEMAEF